MTDVIGRPTGSPSGGFALFAPLLRSLSRVAKADDRRHPALEELPDNLLKDLGLARSDMPLVAGTLASAGLDPDLWPARRALDSLNGRVAERDVATLLSHVGLRLV